MDQAVSIDTPLPATYITDPAAQLLCDLLRLDDRPVHSLQSLQQTDWDALLLRATQQNLGALLHKNIKTSHPGLPIRSDVLQVLHHQHLRDGASALLRMQTLEIILKAFQAQNIPVIALKGVYLAEAIYTDNSVRRMADIDLLVHPTHLELAAQILEEMGYKPWRQFWAEHEMQFSHEMPAFLQVGKPPIELHWTLLEPSLPFAIDLQEIWQRAIPVTIAGVDILGLAAEDLLLHLCMHAPTQHHFRGALRMTYDIALTVSKCHELIDWPVLQQRAREWNADRAAHLMLSLAYQLFGAPVPDTTLQVLQPQPLDPQVMEIACQLLFPELPQEGTFAPNLASMLGIKDPLERVLFTLRRIFITPTELSRHYPVLPGSPRVLLYYPVHLRDVLRKHLLPALRLARGDPEAINSAQSTYQLQELERKLVQKLTA